MRPLPPGWLLQELLAVRREAEVHPELRARVVAHPSGFFDYPAAQSDEDESCSI
jgi:hypothetical protein